MKLPISPLAGEMSGRTEGGDIGWSASAILLVLALFPTEAFAHASDRGHVLLLPTGHYLLGGAAAVAASFIALVFLPAKVLERVAAMRLSLFAPPEGLRIVTSLLSFALLATLVVAGFAGSRDPLSNPLPLTIWTLLWVGITLIQGVIGDVWRWINPWYGPWRLLAALIGKRVVPLRRWWGCWPAFIAFAAFAWFELLYPAPDDPSVLATVVAIYWLATFTAMLIFGFDAWSRTGELLSVFYGMLARFAVLGGDAGSDGRRQRLALRWPGAGLADALALPVSGVAFLLLTLSSVSFDGLSKTFFWLGLTGVNPLEFPGRTAVMNANTNGLVLVFAALAIVYLAAVFIGQSLVGDRSSFLSAAGLLVWSIVPIALAYHFSHYLTVLLVNGQYAMAALSDPFARGWDLFGTAQSHVHAGIAAGSAAAWVVWNLQAAAIILGHVLAVLIAHGLAFRLHPDARKAAFSQLPLTVLMIAYTVFGLWLLSTPTAG